MGLAAKCEEYTMKKLGKATFLSGIVAQIALPNMAFVSKIFDSDIADKLYQYSTLPYALAGSIVGGLLYYCRCETGENGGIK